MRDRLRLVLAAAIGAAFVGCGGDGGDGGTNPPPTPVLTSVTVGPASPTVVVGGTTQLSATALDQNGARMSGTPTQAWTSSDETKATVNATTGLVTGVAVGNPTISVSVSAGGVTKSAQTAIAVQPISASASVTATGSNQFVPAAVTVSSGGTVTWSFEALHNVTFDNPPAAVTGGNVDNQSSGSASRTFPTAGTYNYHCTIHGTAMSGTVTVH